MAGSQSDTELLADAELSGEVCEGASREAPPLAKAEPLETVRNLLEEHPAIAVAQLEVCERQAGQPELVAYLVPDLGTIYATEENLASAAEWTCESVALWNLIFDALYHREPPNDDPTLNSIGWVDSATGEPLSAGEMYVWLADAVQGIRSLEPRRVLEIGCGTGMILYRIAPHCQHVHASDISRQALDLLESRRGQAASQGGLPPNVTLEQAAADELCQRAEGFDVVVINSAVQYFPSIHYLLLVVRNLAESLPHGGAIYLGDVRSLPLLESFYLECLLAEADDDGLLELLSERADVQRQSETELVIDPAFFSSLPQVISRLARVEIVPKRGRGTNEVFRYRYQVTLRIGDPASVPVEEATRLAWLDWQAAGLTLERLRRQLRDEVPRMLGLAAIPNARIDRSRAVARLMRPDAGVQTVGELRKRLPGMLDQDLGVEPEDLWSLAEECGYAMTWSWARHDVSGHFDVYLKRGNSDETANGIGWPEKVLAQDVDATLATRPLAGRLIGNLPGVARAHLEDRGSGGLLPDRYELRVGALPGRWANR